jgi:cation diffusion facilitator family transporter
VAQSEPPSESLHTVVIALAINIAIAFAKALAAAISGSSALVAEAAHSVADTGNEIFLLVALRTSRRPADETHPFGYGADRFFWSLLAAFGIFVAGGLAAMLEGIDQLMHPHRLDSVIVAYVVLAISAGLELTSWRTAYRQLRSESRGRGVGLRIYLRRTSDPTPTTVFYEDSAAVAGIALATVGLVLHQITGSAIPDALASIAIGLLLIFVAVRLAGRERELLTNQSAPAPIVDDFRQVMLAAPHLDRIDRLVVLVVGPRTWLITADVVIAETLSTGQALDALNDVRSRLRENPGVTHVYLTPVRA